MLNNFFAITQCHLYGNYAILRTYIQTVKSFNKQQRACFKINNYALKDDVLFDLILYVPSTIFQLNRDGSSWVEPVLS